MIVAVGFALAMVVRAVMGGASGSLRRRRNLFSMAAAFVFVVAAVLVTVLVAAHFLHTVTNTVSGTR